MSENEANPSNWDQRQLFNMRLHNLLATADRCNIEDDFDNWFDSLRGVRRMINHFLSDNEKLEITALLDKAQKWAKAGNNKRIVDPKIVQDHLDNLHMRLYDLAHKYRLLIPVNDPNAMFKYGG